jgi:very-short-patch-repair endonuclease
MLLYNKKLKRLSQNLRNNMTDAERLLWSKLKGKQVKGLHFYRQKTIGQYIVDFYCAKAVLVIEVDGGQHYIEPGRKRDAARDIDLQQMGLRILRFSDREVLKEIEAVMEKIWAVYESKISPVPSFLKKGEGGF